NSEKVEMLKISQESTPASELPTAGVQGKVDTFEQYRVLIDLIDNVSRNYVHSMTREELIQAAIEGVTSKLDPYSYYIGGADMETFRRDMNSCFGGVGMAVDMVDGKATVMAPLVGMPAYRAGVHCGDVILEIDGKSLEKMKIDEVMELLAGEIGTQVKLRIQRVGKREPIEVTVEREMILMETVFGYDRSADDSWNYWLDKNNGIAYIHVTEFRDETANEIRKVLKQLQSSSESEKKSDAQPDRTESNMESGVESGTRAGVESGTEKSPLRGLILDLRFNPGGDFNVAVEMCNMFISEGVIVSAKGKNTVEEVWRATPEMEIPASMPMVILLNSYSASASEVFSACLQDHNRAVIVGERSYGKGVIQSVLPFEGGNSNLKLTTAGYYSPNGRNIHREEGAGEADEWGVKPADENLVQTSMEEDEMFLRDRNRRGTLKTHNDLPTTKNPASYRDAQLEKALSVVYSVLKIRASAAKTLQVKMAPYQEKTAPVRRTNRRW
ncbi:MAG: S41 family peptidase, partial [Planctomycetia bacterium]|nr:S41 family peptidase [Planctomycetia bacterium]